MEGKRSSPKPTDLLQRIRDFTRLILVDLCNGRSPVVLINKFRNYCTNSAQNCFCSSTLPIGKEVLTLQKQPNAHRMNVLLRVLLIVQQLLQESRHASKREIYYMWPSLFKDQSIVDRAINEICILLECSRHNLNVVSVSKGLVMGWIKFFEDGKKFDCMTSPNTAQPIPVYVEEVHGIQVGKTSINREDVCYDMHIFEVHEEIVQYRLVDILSFSEYILLVEKESVFQRLANDQFCSFNQCIVMTGRGYPDVPTRRFLRLLTQKLRIPAYCLVDSDPYGFDILTTYRFGSLEMAYDREFLCIPNICWIGAFTSDCERYSVPSRCLLPLTTEDKKRTEALLNRCYLQHEEPRWRLELEMMLEKGVKFEIEALSVHSLSYLSKEYLPSKLRGKGMCSFVCSRVSITL